MPTSSKAANHAAAISIAPATRPPNMKFHHAALVCWLFFWIGLSAASSNAQTPEAGSGSSLSLANRLAPAGTQPQFQFHSGFWVNLHHFLYLQARIQSHELTRVGAAASNYSAQAVTLPANAPGAADWARAVDYYVKTFANRDSPPVTLARRRLDRRHDRASHRRSIVRRRSAPQAESILPEPAGPHSPVNARAARSKAVHDELAQR